MAHSEWSSCQTQRHSPAHHSTHGRRSPQTRRLSQPERGEIRFPGENQSLPLPGRRTRKSWGLQLWGRFTRSVMGKLTGITMRTASGLMDSRWCQRVCRGGRKVIVDSDKLPSLILLVFDLETAVGSLYIRRGHRLWANVFPIESRSVRASCFTTVLKWLFMGRLSERDRDRLSKECLKGRQGTLIIIYNICTAAV